MPEDPGPVGAPGAAADPRPTRRGRPMVLLALAIVLGSAATVSAGAMTWWSQSHLDALSGAVVTTAKGNGADNLLVPVALVALAGFGAALAASGWLRRVVGLVLVAGGAWAGILAVTGFFSSPASLLTDLTRPPESSAAPALHPLGPLLGTVGGVLIAVAGVMVVVGVGARRTLGARYEAPSGRRRTEVPREPEPGSPSAADRELSEADWWKAPDAGQDPTEKPR